MRASPIPNFAAHARKKPRNRKSAGPTVTVARAGWIFGALAETAFSSFWPFAVDCTWWTVPIVTTTMSANPREQPGGDQDVRVPDRAPQRHAHAARRQDLAQVFQREHEREAEAPGTLRRMVRQPHRRGQPEPERQAQDRQPEAVPAITCSRPAAAVGRSAAMPRLGGRWRRGR